MSKKPFIPQNVKLQSTNKNFTIDKIRIEKNNKNLFSEEANLTKEALRIFSKNLDNIKLNESYEFIMGDYKHKLIIPDPIQIAKRYKRFRKTIRLTQREMAFITSSTPQTVYQIENAKAVPSIVWALNMIKYFDLNIHWFLTGEATMFVDRNFLDEKFNELTEENIKLKKDLTRKNKMLDKLFQENA